MGIFGQLKRTLRFIPARQMNQICGTGMENKPKHLICFKQWTAEMVMEIINSAINLKNICPDTHMAKMNILDNAKVLILEEVNEPFLFAAISKAVTFLGGQDIGIIDKVLWDSDYNGRVFSGMSDAIFVSTTTHMGVQRLANKSSVPVLCVKSRTHASIQGLAIVMTIMETIGTMKDINVCYVGPPRQILNSLLLLCPMLGANIRFKCSCPMAQQSPLLYKMGQDLVKEMGVHLTLVECTAKEKALKNANVIIAGPTTHKKDKIKYFEITSDEINCQTNNWMFIHCCPKGKEVSDDLFYSPCSFTFAMFDNMQYIAAALMANSMKDHLF